MKSIFLPDHIVAKLNKEIPHSSEVFYTSAPGRINLIGEHTDYNNGFVLPAAIDRCAYFAFVPNGKRAVVVHALDKSENVSLDLDSLVKTRYDWANFLVGLLLEFESRGIELQGFNCAFTSEVPIGAGMSSSSALECAFLVGINYLYNAELQNWELIKISKSSNHNFLGIKGGIMDQFAALFGQKDKIMLLNCDTNEHEYITIPNSPYSWLLINTCVKHNHLSSGYNNRVKECAQALVDIQKQFPDIKHLSATEKVQLSEVNFSSSLISRRAEYIVEENARVRAFKSGLENEDFQLCGQLLYASHKGLSNKYEVSCEELDFLVDALVDDAEVLGSRMMGGGFGGCTINLVKTSAIPNVKRKITMRYQQAFGIDPALYNVKISGGAKVVLFS